MDIVSISFGKDSLAMTLKMLEKGMNIDKLVFADTGMEFDEIYKTKEKFIKDTGIEVINLPISRNFVDMMIKDTVHKRNGTTRKGYGWCGKQRWGTSYKQLAIKNYIKQFNSVIEYHGIAFDEPKRLEKNKGRNIVYPLCNWKMTEKECLNYCYSKGYTWNGLYNHLDRVSCWCCQNKNEEELYYMWKEYPQMWQQLKEWQKIIPEPFKKKTFKQMEKKFNNKLWWEEHQVSMF